jgi:ribokinase
LRVACVGHVEWIEFVRLDHLPRAGEIVHASAAWEEPGGGGTMAAVQLARLGDDEASFFTALGDDDLGRRAHDELERLGLRVHVAWRPEPQRRAFTYLDADGERTITVLGDRLVPAGADDLPWDELDGADAVYVTGGDAEAIRRARAARVLTATPRVGPALRESGVALDALILSANDPGERRAGDELAGVARLVVWTEGAKGGRWTGGEGRTDTFKAAALPGPKADAYGAGDCFAACTTYGLGAGKPVEEAVALGARCGAEAMTRPGAWTFNSRSASGRAPAPPS